MFWSGSLSQPVSHMQRKVVPLVLWLLPIICVCNQVTTAVVLLVIARWMDFWVIIFICSLFSPSGPQSASDCCTGETTSIRSGVSKYVNVCHTDTRKVKTNTNSQLSAGSNSLPSPVCGACAHRGADGGENARFLLLCLRATKGIKGPFFYF